MSIIPIVTARVPRPLRLIAAPILSSACLWGIAVLCHRFEILRATAAMLMLLGVLAIAALGDPAVALVTSLAASIAFDWYFVDTPTSLQVTSSQGGVALAAMILTALTGSQLSSRAQRRAAEAELRRSEMERLNELGRVLLSAGTVAEAGRNSVQALIDLFGVERAVLSIDGAREKAFDAGGESEFTPTVIALGSGSHKGLLEIYGSAPSGEVRSAIASMITLVLERARAAEEHSRIEATRRGEELRSTVLNALAHDFRTPLTSIKVAASALRSSVSITDDQREMAIAIDEEADRLAQLIRESLDLAKIQSYRDSALREACDIREIVERISGRVSRYLGKRQLVIDISENLPAIMADSFLLEQMLIQVVDNAWKYSRPGSAIEIRAELSAGEMLMTVRNEGSQIPECERALIFDRFYRGARDRSRVEGTGLGLAIARTIAEAFGGRIWLDMEQEGPAFRFALPME